MSEENAIKAEELKQCLSNFSEIVKEHDRQHESVVIAECESGQDDFFDRFLVSQENIDYLNEEKRKLNEVKEKMVSAAKKSYSSVR